MNTPAAIRAAITCMRLSGRISGDIPDDLLAQWGAVQDMAREIDRETGNELADTKRDLITAREQRDNLCWQLGKCEGIAKGLLKPGEFAPEGMEPCYEPLEALLAVSDRVAGSEVVAKAAKVIHDAHTARVQAAIDRATPLSQASNDYARTFPHPHQATWSETERAFIAGANWQKESGT